MLLYQYKFELFLNILDNEQEKIITQKIQNNYNTNNQFKKKFYDKANPPEEKKMIDKKSRINKSAGFLNSTIIHSLEMGDVLYERLKCLPKFCHKYFGSDCFAIKESENSESSKTGDLVNKNEYNINDEKKLVNSEVSK